MWCFQNIFWRVKVGICGQFKVIYYNLDKREMVYNSMDYVSGGGKGGQIFIIILMQK